MTAPGSRTYNLMMPTLDMEAKLLGVFSRKNAERGAGIYTCKKVGFAVGATLPGGEFRVHLCIGIRPGN